MGIRSNKDLLAGLIYIFFGVAAILIARDYNMGTVFKMGPAYFPTVLSVFLIVVGAISVIRAFIVQGTPIGVISLKGLGLVTASIVVFGLVVRGAGLAIALPLLLFISAAGSSRFRWQTMAMIAVGLTVFCVLVFVKGLGIPLPIVGPWFAG
ncbi:MAG: tripartite tricarboxylate transporter TctB family protein [Deltaproteobacteria bacterium]|nr:tripartite tricarboxylate transporter TctB family protein [Deltaproteobacteria bacterium]